MNKEEFLSKKGAIEKELVKLHREKKNLEKTYIESNMRFPIGSKVKLTFKPDEVDRLPAKEVYAIVKGYKLIYDDEVRPILAKLTKSGAAHKTAQEYVQWWRCPVVEQVRA